MGKKELATLIDAYADAKASGNKYLTRVMIDHLQAALDSVCTQEDEGEYSSEEDLGGMLETVS